MSKLELALLGDFVAVYNGQPIRKLRTTKAQALLAYLAVETAQPHPREAIFDLLWPGLPEPSARANLRQITYQLRKSFPEVGGQQDDATVPLLQSNHGTIQLNPDANITTDVAQFQQQLKAVFQHAHSDVVTCTSCLQRLQATVALYNGRFLSNLYVADSNTYEDWLLVQREALQRALLDALGLIGRIHLAHGRFADAERVARQQLAIDNLRESAHRQLLEALARSGQRSAALAHYGELEKLLNAELGMTPSRKTTQLAQAIVDDELDRVVAQSVPVRGYELLERLGEGSFGAVHRAYQPQIGRAVAVKIIKAEFANRPNFIRRFEHEAQTIARLEHPHIVPLYDYWREPDRAYLVMRYLRGGTLRQSLTQGAWSVDRAVALVVQIASALAVAHQHGIIHRDVNPNNILLDERGNGYLSDFGIAREQSDLLAPSRSSSPAYRSPEEQRNEAISPRTDIYSLGMLLREAVNGAAGSALAAVIACATADDPTERFADVLSFAAAVQQAAADGDSDDAPLPVLVTENPYRGLRAFQEGDAGLFFGRKQLTDQLLTQLTTSRFLAVVGPSGSGKSSVVKAGLIPKLRDGELNGSEKWYISEMVPSTHPLEELEAALLRVAVDPPASLLEPLQKDARGLVRVLKRILPPNDPDGQLLLVIDQFEELFTLVEDDDRRQQFLAILLEALEAPRSQLRVVITLRADFFHAPLQQPQLAHWLQDNTAVVVPLTPFELEAAITQPAALAGVRVEPQLVKRIIADVSDQIGMLPLLQYALTELFEQRDAQQHVMPLSAYSQTGGIAAVLGQRAEAIYGELSAENQALTRQLFLRLVTLGAGVEDTRRRVLMSELESLFNDGRQTTDDGQNNATLILDSYGNARLLSFDRDPATRQPTVEVAHEALLREWGRLRGWLDESRADVQLQRVVGRESAEWHAANRDPAYLLRGSRLEQFIGWSETTTVALTATERAYLDASNAAHIKQIAQEEARRQQQLKQAQQLAETQRQRAEEQTAAAGRLRQRAVLLAGAMAIATVAAVAAVIFGRRATIRQAEAQNNANLAATREVEAQSQRSRAEEQTRLAFARELAAQANLALGTDPERTLLLALESLDLAYTTDGETALHTGLQQSRVRTTIQNDALFTAMSPDGHYLISSGVSSDETPFTVRDTASQEVLFTGEGEIYQFIDDTRFLIDLPPYDDDDFTLVVYDVKQQTIVNYPIVEKFSLSFKEVTRAKISHTGQFFSASYVDGRVALWDAATGLQLLESQPFDRAISNINFSPDDKLLIASDFSDQAYVWDISNVRDTGALEQVAAFTIFNGDAGGAVGFTFFDNNRQLAVSGPNGTEIRALANPTVVTAANGETSTNAQPAVLNSDFSLLAVGDSHQGVHVMEVATGETYLSLQGHSGQVQAVGFSADDTQLITQGTGDKALRYWDVRPLNGSETEAFPTVPFAMSLQTSPDGSLFGVGGRQGAAYLIDRTTGKVVHTLAAPSDSGIYRLDFSPDGKTVVTVGEDDFIRMWDVATGAMRLEFEGHQSDVFGGFFEGTMEVRWQPDGLAFATASSDGLVKLWDGATGELIRTFEPYPVGLSQLMFTPDGQLLIGGGETGPNGNIEIWVWDVETGEHVRTLGAMPLGQTFGIEHHPSESLVAVAGWNRTLKAWNPVTGELIYETLVPGNGTLYQPAFSPDGNFLAVSGGSAPTSLLDAYTGELKLILTDTALGGLDFSADGRLFGAQWTDGGVREITVLLDDAMALAQRRVTRELTEAECLQYLRSATCEPTVAD